MNKKSLKFWEELSNKTVNPYSVKLSKNNDYTAFDEEFVLQFCTKDTEILDLASGTGLLINRIQTKVKRITAVEKFKKFSDLIEKSPNIQITNQDIKDFETDKTFDLILMFGIISYFNEEEIINIYKKYKQFLKPNGKLIIKNQFGVHEDVAVEGFSEELKTNYYSEYRHLTKEKNILESLCFKNIEVEDIYPKECNRWDNTHFYAITAEV